MHLQYGYDVFLVHGEMIFIYLFLLFGGGL